MSGVSALPHTCEGIEMCREIRSSESKTPQEFHPLHLSHTRSETDIRFISFCGELVSCSNEVAELLEQGYIAFGGLFSRFLSRSLCPFLKPSIRTNCTDIIKGLLGNPERKDGDILKHRIAKSPLECYTATPCRNPTVQNSSGKMSAHSSNSNNRAKGINSSSNNSTLCREFTTVVSRSHLGNLGNLSQPGGSKIAKQSWSSCPTCPTCPPTRLPFGDQECKIAGNLAPPCPTCPTSLPFGDKIARLLGNLVQIILLNSRHTVSLY